jgi:urate oxidase
MSPFFPMFFFLRKLPVVLKSTGSAFENFVRDEYTTLGEVKDRILSTSVDLKYTYVEEELRLPREDDEKGRVDFGEQNFNENEGGRVYTWEDTKVGAVAREITLDVFANDESASVQVRGNGQEKPPTLFSNLILWRRGITL